MLLQSLDDGLVGRLCLAVGLRVMQSGEVEFDPPFLAKVLEFEADELRAIFRDYLFGDPKVAYDILPNEFLHFAILDLGGKLQPRSIW